MMLYFSIVSPSCMRYLFIYLFIHSFLLLSLLVDSGHGGQTKDTDGDEADGFDEGRDLFYLNDLFFLANIKCYSYSYLSCEFLAYTITDVVFLFTKC